MHRVNSRISQRFFKQERNMLPSRITTLALLVASLPAAACFTTCVLPGSALLRRALSRPAEFRQNSCRVPARNSAALGMVIWDEEAVQHGLRFATSGMRVEDLAERSIAAWTVLRSWQIGEISASVTSFSQLVSLCHLCAAGPLARQ